MELTIDVINKNAMYLLNSMEQMHLIRLRSNVSKQKLSKKFAGALHLSNAEYENFNQYLKESRNEWDRNI
jgi:hypothetical protein